MHNRPDETGEYLALLDLYDLPEQRKQEAIPLKAHAYWIYASLLDADDYPEVVDAYYKSMPNAIGFLNGYAPAYTFTVRDKRPLLSYDYYLSPTRPEDDAVADLHELAQINKKRPYFLLLHVRESSDIKRVKNILDKLNPDFELVPLDIFLKMASEKPTYKERFLKK